METFGVAAVETATGRQVEPEMFGGEPAWIDYRGPPNTIRAVSFSDVVQGQVKTRLLPRQARGGGALRPVAPGRSPDLHDRADEQMSGAEIQANAIDTMRRGLPLDSGPGRSTSL